MNAEVIVCKTAHYILSFVVLRQNSYKYKDYKFLCGQFGFDSRLHFNLATSGKFLK